MKKLGYLLGLASCWGPSYLCVLWALESCSPFSIAMIRLGIATLVVGTILAVMRIPFWRQLKSSLPIIPFAFFSSSLPFSLIALSETQIASSLAAVLNGSTPLFTVLISVVLLRKERASISRIMGILVGILGLTLVYLPSLTLAGSSSLGFIAMLAASLCYAIGMVYGRTLQDKGLASSTIVFYQVFYGFLFLVPVVFLTNPPSEWIVTNKFLFACFYTGIISTSLAFFFYQMVLKNAGATYLSTAVLIAPLISLLLGNWFEGETLSLIESLGAFCIFAGLILVNEMLPIRKKTAAA